MTVMQTTFMSEEDKKAVKFAINRHVPIHRYRYKGVDVDGYPYEYETFFTPAQFRAITTEPYPECVSAYNCSRLIDIWNRASARGIYTLLDPQIMQ